MSSRLTISRAARLLQSFRISPWDLSRYCRNVAAFGENVLKINAFSCLLSDEEILQQAEASGHRLRNGSSRGVLEGIPITIKGNIAVRDFPLTASSQILGATTGDAKNKLSAEDRNVKTLHQRTAIQRCGYDSYVAHKLLQECGAVLIGITEMDEFGMGSLGNNCSGSECTKNPVPYVDHIWAQLGPAMDEFPFYTQIPLSSIPSANELRSDIHLRRILDDMWVEKIKKFCITEQWQESRLLSVNYDDVPTLSAGGSSCGSAASVAMGSSLASLGTDTGGSIRLPAAWCNVVGMKPSYGLISRHGVISYASSLDTVGVIGPTVSCVSKILDVLIHKQCGEEPFQAQVKDSTAITFHPASFVSEPLLDKTVKAHKCDSSINLSLESGCCLKGITVGIPSAFSIEEYPLHIKSAWEDAVDKLHNLGAQVKIVPSSTLSPDLVKRSLAAYYILACAEASSNLSRYDGLRYGRKYTTTEDRDNFSEVRTYSEETAVFDKMGELEQKYSAFRARYFGNEVIRRILAGTAVLSTDRFHSHYEAAARIRADLTSEFTAAFDKSGDKTKSAVLHGDVHVDCILIPTTFSMPPRLGAKVNAHSDLESFANDALTVPSSLAGLPSISIPWPVSNRIGPSPSNFVGLQIIGPKLSEEVILRTASAMSQSVFPSIHL